MKQFKDFGIKVTLPNFIGDKVNIMKVINKEITVYHFKVVPSIKNTGECLHLQIGIGENRHVLFSGSRSLIEMIKHVKETDFPFKTVIEKKDERYQFT